MTEKDILRDMHGDIKAMAVDVKNHGKQLDTVFELMNGGGCATGRANAVAIKWLYAVGGIVTTGIMGVIAFFHLGK